MAGACFQRLQPPLPVHHTATHQYQCRVQSFLEGVCEFVRSVSLCRTTSRWEPAPPATLTLVGSHRCFSRQSHSVQTGSSHSKIVRLILMFSFTCAAVQHKNFRLLQTLRNQSLDNFQSSIKTNPWIIFQSSINIVEILLDTVI